MKRWAALFVGALFASTVWPQPTARSFLEEQMAHPRVKTAAREKDASWRELFQRKNLHFPPRRLLLLAFKRESDLEVWAESGDSGKYVLIKTFRICASSSELGPKRRYGDGQVPEGFYEIDHCNPQSAYYLSLHVSYPNASDRILGSRVNPGEKFLFMAIA
jgi:murein L,D-transpeptidase YafK